MISIRAAVDEAGLLKSCRVSGHAGAGKRGRDLVCAAVSVLARTALKTLSGREGVMVRGGAPERGLFWIETDFSGGGGDFLAGAGAFLLEGLASVAEEYPDFCEMTICIERRN